MEFGQKIIRNPDAVIQDVELEELGSGILLNMPGFHNSIPGLHAVARDNQGIVVGIAKINLSADEERELSKLRKVIQLDSEILFGIS